MGRHAAALLLLTDGRFPAGGYAHSGGLEPAVISGRVRDVAGLEAFLHGRASTVGLVNAAFAAAACRAGAVEDGDRLAQLEAELDARMPSPAQRATSRQLGRQFLRVVHSITTHPVSRHLPARPHQPVVFGVTAAVLGLEVRDAALAMLHESVAGPVAAAVRLLSVDPFDTHAALARLGPLLDDLADRAEEVSAGPAGALPAATAPLLDIDAEQHATRDGRLFAS